jgi:hypothetical protein
VLLSHRRRLQRRLSMAKVCTTKGFTEAAAAGETRRRRRKRTRTRNDKTRKRTAKSKEGEGQRDEPNGSVHDRDPHSRGSGSSISCTEVHFVHAPHRMRHTQHSTAQHSTATVLMRAIVIVIVNIIAVGVSSQFCYRSPTRSPMPRPLQSPVKQHDTYSVHRDSQERAGEERSSPQHPHATDLI